MAAGGGIKVNNTTIRGGADGATFVPSIDANGNLSWNNNKGYPNPATIKIKGEDGEKGDTGAKLVSQVLIGQDANGGNIYQQTFDDGTTATFTAPRGERGENGASTGYVNNAIKNNIFALIFHNNTVPAWSTNGKTLTIKQYSRIITTKGIYVDPMATGNVVIDLSSIQHGFIVYDISSSQFVVYSYSASVSNISSTSLLIAVYANYGEIVSMAGSYTIDGNLYGIDIPTIPEIIAQLNLPNFDVPSFGYLFNTSKPAIEFDTTNKRIKFNSYSSVFSNTTRYGLPTSDTYIDITNTQNGIILYNTSTSQLSVVSYTATYLLNSSNLIILGFYSNYGAVVNTASSYKIDGNLYGIDIPTIPDPPYVPTQPSLCPSYEYWDMSGAGFTAWSDITKINGNMWAFYPSADETHTDTSGAIKIIDISTTPMTLVKTISHNFGHCNTVDYCADTDCLIIGNLPGNTTYPAALYIFYNVSSWENETSLDFNSVDKTIIDLRSAFNDSANAICAWGENNFALHNIVYITTNYDNRVAKIVLGMGTNQYTYGTYTATTDTKFNGTYKVLEQSTFTPMNSVEEVVQGATFYQGKFLTANGDNYNARASLWGFDANGKIQRQLLEFPIYQKDTGAINANYKTYTEGIMVDGDYVYQGVFSGQLYTIRFYLIKYKI